eukprot:gnl/MRDRNA2_/MRDRNA2_144847_c0_seq1.p1 gnl/MRDRNA2_/MRDRNA2_144847_c0~~gnl/MRDRNA2_/MRDRNA2_144847_c0_seq1.p1  ORF type:complete len:430 (-),score=58.33 gnl/MRDRNA2_/MRDRNA2_144847_c0_seq1:137-1426(-)
MGAIASSPFIAQQSGGGLREKVEKIMNLEDPSEEDIKAVISELPQDIRKKVRRVFDDMHDDPDQQFNFYDPTNFRGSLCESILKHQIENNGKPPPDRVAIEEDMKKAREFWKRPVNLPPIQADDSDPGETVYHPPPEAYPDYTKVPQGSIIHIDGFQGAGERSVFPGVKRNMEIYLPAQLTDNPDIEPALILFNDGYAYFEDGHGCHILDSLIHAGSIPVTVGVFVENGRPVDCPRFEDVEGSDDEQFKLKVQLINEYHRKIEYDSPTEKFPKFIRDELLPFVLEKCKEKCNLKSFSKDPAQRCAVGISSSAMQAFNMAWQHPHLWGRVLSHCGSFVSLNGGHNYPFIVRRSDRTGRKNLRIALASGSNDNVDDVYGSFALANHTMADALRFAGYDYRYDFGVGGHDLCYGSALLAEHLKWLLGGGNGK